mmetsp:Transcript_24926/g.37294  ORF Transcript_24926/g.37294 Transcript_24926/m.37294 type:complete len:714 (+) Transcript_24926:284-2425(+)
MLVRDSVFTHATENERKELVNSFEKVSTPPKTELTRQGKIADFYYIIHSGVVRVVAQDEGTSNSYYVMAPMSFGNKTLMYDCPDTFSRFTHTDCVLWRIDRCTARRVIASKALQSEYHTKELLRRVPFLADLDDQKLSRISDSLNLAQWKKGDVIISKGEMGHSFHIIKEGKVRVSNIAVGQSPYVDRILGPGEYVGERALLTGDKTTEYVTAETSCVTLCLPADVFQKVLGPLQQAIDKSMDLRYLMGVPILVQSNFEPFEWENIAAKIEEVRFSANTIICLEGVVTRRALYSIRSGKICIQKEGCEPRIIETGGYFGENSLASFQRRRSITYEPNEKVFAMEDSVCRMITLSAIISAVGPERRIGIPSIKVSQLSPIEVSDLKMHRIIGVGTFGKVWMVTHKTNGMPFALKVLNKKDILKKKQTKMIIREKEIMEALDHPFITKLVNTYRDEKCVYMLTRLVQGGELFSLMRNGTVKKLKEPGAKFYSACVIAALSYMHNRNIAYRDLKAENILIDKHGFAVIVDLGFAKKVHEKTFTFCGTPLYMAPEIILGKGHNKSADHWSFGVLIYELTIGKSPFYKKGQTHNDTFIGIIRNQYSFPQSLSISEDSKDLIQRLLVVNPANRLGNFSKADTEVREHSWFSEVSFVGLVQRDIRPPWIPDIRSPIDVSNYDNFDHIEKPPEETKASISAAQQKNFPSLKEPMDIFSDIR